MQFAIILQFLKKYWLVILLVMLGLVLLKPIRRFVQNIILSFSVGKYGNQTSDPDNPESKINLNVVAYNIYDAFYNRGFGWGWTEDEEYAISELKKVPKKLIPQLAQEYVTIGKKAGNLYEDFRKFLRDDQYEQVSNLLR